MGEVKWIRLSINMFDNRKIKYLRSLPEGNNIILIWVALLTIAGRCNAGGMIFLTENIPYTTKMLADELDFEENIIVLALNALRMLGMVQDHDEALLITGWEEHQNVDGLEKIREQSRKRVAKYREKQKELPCNVTVTPDVTPCNAIEREIELEIDKEKDIKHIVHEARALFEDLWKLYPSKKGKGQVSDTKKKELLKIGKEELERAIDRYKADLKKDVDWRKTQNGSTFFNSGYVDYLDNNYEGGKNDGTPGGRTGSNEKGLIAEAIAAGVSTEFEGFGNFD
ncbi:phage replisome organizer N-terminal domain-containing protein [Lacrimispora sp.]|uniref:phage replisome organizer N-terminal domain-containing protein n=1 Tax=Lacrimispora sp. TaxID=2719234 RepID=UPI0028A85789|nr:phage replisome organizer N-terminal domain-containing protein [Lacrimispora sp.]